MAESSRAGLRRVQQVVILMMDENGNTVAEDSCTRSDCMREI
jgi:hypothetical protein